MPKDSNVVTFTGITKLDMPVDRVLQAALDAEPTEVVIIGFDKDGEFYFSSSIVDGGTVMFHLELAKRRLIDICLNDDD